MKLIIEIPEYVYNNIKEYYETHETVEATYSYIYHGTPLIGTIIIDDDGDMHKVYKGDKK